MDEHLEELVSELGISEGDLHENLTEIISNPEVNHAFTIEELKFIRACIEVACGL